MWNQLLHNDDDFIRIIPAEERERERKSEREK